MRSVFRNSVRCSSCIVHSCLLALWVIGPAETGLAEESPTTKTVRLQLEQRTAERDAAAKERRSRTDAVSTTRKKIEQLRNELASATEQLRKHQQARQQAADTETQAATAAAQLAELLKKHQAADALQAAVVVAREHLDAGLTDLVGQRDRLAQLKRDSAEAGEAAEAALLQSESYASEATLKQPELVTVRAQVRDAELALESARVHALQTSRQLVEQQRQLGLGTFEVNRARKTAGRLANVSQAIQSSIGRLESVGERGDGSVSEGISQLTQVLEGLTAVQLRAEELVDQRTAEADRLQRDVRQASEAWETAERERRTRAESHSDLSRRHFLLQRDVARLMAASERRKATATAETSRRQRLTDEIAQAEQILRQHEADVDGLRIAFMEATRRANLASKQLSVVTAAKEVSAPADQ